MGDQILGHYAGSRGFGKGIPGKDEKTGDDVSNFEQKLKKIWIYSSGKKIGSFGQTRNGNKVSNAPVSVSKPTVSPRIKLNGCLRQSPVNRQSQIKLDGLLNHRMLPSGVADNEKQGENGFLSDNRRKEVQKTSSLPPKSSTSSGNLGSSVELPLEKREIRESLQKMSDEIMRYELRLASLYGRIAVLSKENERLRDDRALRESLAAQLVDETKSRESKRLDIGVQEHNKRVDSAPSIGESGEGEHATTEGQGVSPRELSKSNETAYGKLKQLESRILGRLEEYETLTAIAEQNISATSDERKAFQLESPFVMELKAKIIRLHEELTQVRSIHDARLTNMKRAFQREQDTRFQLEQRLAYDKQIFQKWARFGQTAGEYIKQFKFEIQEQNKTILYYKNKEAQMNNLQGNYKTAVESYKSLSELAEARRKDIELLNTQLEHSKLENKSLEAVIHRQREQIEGLSRAETRPLTDFPASTPQDGLPHSHLLHSTTHEYRVNNFNSEAANQRLLSSNTSFRAATPSNMQNGINDSGRAIKQESPVLNPMSDKVDVYLESPSANEHRDRTSL
ncbi:hypothetical protein HG536_0H01960 [Torulaspora globosa]|uniref:Uncharacterized protein n=1 Tax=Torulaspora globosa TaxID=48254 RepID=A0A7G3ZMT5_9SACH|nr:uncharacterized protein HG536_0H01960 [Torulaspora globosa]QLL34821.1 hypothetical protein HG536_0H01960 [Torulaspora globosa]